MQPLLQVGGHRRASWQWVLTAVLRAFWWSVMLTAPLASPAAVVISNVPATTDGGSLVSHTEWKALLFTSGPSAGQIDSLDLGLNPPAGMTLPGTPSVKVSLFSVVGGVPDTSLAATDLTPVSISATRQLYTLASAPLFTLAANTEYALVVSSDATGIRWANNTGNEPVAGNGFQYNGFKVTSDGGTLWSDPSASVNVLQVRFTAVPEPAWGTTLVGTALGLGAWRWCRRRSRQERPHLSRSHRD